MIDRHVEHETDAQRERPDEEREGLHDEEEKVDRHERPTHPRAEEVLHVAEPVLLNAVVVEHREDDRRATEGDVPVRRRRRKPRDYPEEIAEQDEERERPD